MMPRGMKGHFIETMTGAIICVQHRRFRIGLEAPLDGLFAGCDVAKRGKLFRCPRGSVALHAFNQRRVRLEHIVVGKRGNLIEHLMRRVTGGNLCIE